MVEVTPGRMAVLNGAKQVFDGFQKDPDIGQNVYGMGVERGKIVIHLGQEIDKTQENWETYYPKQVKGIEFDIEYRVLPPEKVKELDRKKAWKKK